MAHEMGIWATTAILYTHIYARSWDHDMSLSKTARLQIQRATFSVVCGISVLHCYFLIARMAENIEHVEKSTVSMIRRQDWTMPFFRKAAFWLIWRCLKWVLTVYIRHAIWY